MNSDGFMFCQNVILEMLKESNVVWLYVVIF